MLIWDLFFEIIGAWALLKITGTGLNERSCSEPQKNKNGRDRDPFFVCFCADQPKLLFIYLNICHLEVVEKFFIKKEDFVVMGLLLSLLYLLPKLSSHQRVDEDKAWLYYGSVYMPSKPFFPNFFWNCNLLF